MHGVLIPLSEYLTTSYRPDREYLDGAVVERNLGEREHSALQVELAIILSRMRRQLGFHIFTEQRVQVTEQRFRVPDVCVLVGPKPTQPIFTTPPFLCIEILSKDDRMSEMQERIDDYLKFGVGYVWVVDPLRRRAHIHTSEGSREVKDGILGTSNPEITVALDELFAVL